MDIARKHYKTDVCIVGGGLAGTIAAISAAREGAKVVLIQDRPMLGGNASSEIRMWVRGAKGPYNRETGILSEFEEENIYRNPTLAPTLFDSVLFGKVKAEKNITLLLNTSCVDGVSENGELKSVTAWQTTTYTWHTVEAKLFLDCSGDSILAPISGALHRIGREAESEYGESIAQKVADNKTMGMSLLLQARETDHKVPFISPVWAKKYKTDADFGAESVLVKGDVYNSRKHSHVIGTSGNNFWWIELGGDEEAIRYSEEARDELLATALGMWDHLKNYGDHGCDNWELEWVGFLPGKRESVRYIGEYVMTQNDVASGGNFEDTIAYGGWPMDDHNPAGIRANQAEPSKLFPAPSPYGIPYRSLYSANVKNLMFAGRNISVTHAALSSTRVMGTCSLLGQAVGTAAAMCIERGILPNQLKQDVCILQQKLLQAGVFLPNVKREISSLTKSASLNITDEEKSRLWSGVDRPRTQEDENRITLKKGEALTFTFDEKKNIPTLRVQFDLDYSRQSLTPNMKMQWFAQKLHRGLDFVPMKVANTIVKDFEVFADGESVYRENANYHSLVNVPINRKAKEVKVVFYDTWGCEAVRLFACDFVE